MDMTRHTSKHSIEANLLNRIQLCNLLQLFQNTNIETVDKGLLIVIYEFIVFEIKFLYFKILKFSLNENNKIDRNSF